MNQLRRLCVNEEISAAALSTTARSTGAILHESWVRNQLDVYRPKSLACLLSNEDALTPDRRDRCVFYRHRSRTVYVIGVFLLDKHTRSP